MPDQRWERVWDLFDRCVALPSGERTAYLDRECDGDGETLAEVRRMLEADAADGYTQPQAVRRASGGSDPEAGRMLGPYRLVERIGAGGMGSVYLAERADEEFEQRVAIKLIKRGMDTDDILARFKNERQVLAQLEHPGIARLIDGGSTDDGRPYLVMEHVEGEPIDGYCEAQGLGTRERIELFREVCDAVHFAHTNGVVHRDLKPSNVLVTGEGRPKLLDFGIAKVVDLAGSAQTVDVTMTELRLMTPEYASPEQVRGDPITTATDVYGLGVVLYELLSGQRPYRITTRQRGDLERAVCEDDPPRPSTVAAKDLRSRLAGDLDTIILMALRKEPDLRYASVHELSEDLGRHLAGEPVLARPSTWRYRSAKFVRRNKLLVGSSLAVLAALVAGLVGIGLMFLRSEDARREAERREYVARVSAAALALERFDTTLARLHLDEAPPALRGWEWRHLAARADGSAATVLEVEGDTGDVAFSADGRWAVSFGWDDHDWIVLWDTVDWSEVRRWRTESNVQSVALNPDGSLVAAAVFMQGFRVWNRESDAPLHRWDFERTAPRPLVAFSRASTLVAAEGSGFVRLLDCASGEERASFRQPTGDIAGLTVLEPDLGILTVSTAGAFLHDPTTGETSRRALDVGTPKAAAFHSDNEGADLVAIGGDDGTLRVFRGEELLCDIRAHEQGISALAFAPDGRRLASASRDRTIRVWDPSTEERLALLLDHVHGLAFSPDGKALLTGGGRTVRLWNTAANDVRTVKAGGGWFTDAVFVPDGRSIVSGGGKKLESFELPSQDTRWSVDATDDPADRIRCTAVSPDGRNIVTGSGAGVVRLWSADPPTVSWEASVRGPINRIAFRPGGNELATASPQRLTILRAKDGEVLFELDAGNNVAWTPDGSRLLNVTDAAGGRKLVSYAADTGRPSASAVVGVDTSALACSPDGRVVATGSQDGVIRLWDTATLEELRRLEGHSGGVRCLTFTPDGARLVSGSQDRTVRVWDPATSRLLVTLRGHLHLVDSVAFSPDGSTLVSKSSDGEIRVWDSLAP